MPNKTIGDVKAAGLRGTMGAGDATRGGATQQPHHADATASATRSRAADAGVVALERPAFTRGASVLDGTAVTSAAPTPAGEVANPMARGSGPAQAQAQAQRQTQRQRESHLPDLDAGSGDGTGSGALREAVGGARGTADELGPEGGEEAGRGRRDTTTRREGWDGA